MENLYRTASLDEVRSGTELFGSTFYRQLVFEILEHLSYLRRIVHVYCSKHNAGRWLHSYASHNGTKLVFKAYKQHFYSDATIPSDVIMCHWKTAVS